MQNISYVIADPKDEHCLGLIAGKKEGPWFFYGLKTVLQVSFKESISVFKQNDYFVVVNSLKELSTRLQQFQMPSLKSEKQHQKIKKRKKEITEKQEEKTKNRKSNFALNFIFKISNVCHN